MSFATCASCGFPVLGGLLCHPRCTIKSRAGTLLTGSAHVDTVIRCRHSGETWQQRGRRVVQQPSYPAAAGVMDARCAAARLHTTATNGDKPVVALNTTCSSGRLPYPAHHFLLGASASPRRRNPQIPVDLPQCSASWQVLVQHAGKVQTPLMRITSCKPILQGARVAQLAAAARHSHDFRACSLNSATCLPMNSTMGAFAVPDLGIFACDGWMVISNASAREACNRKSLLTYSPVVPHPIELAANAWDRCCQLRLGKRCRLRSLS